jgi:hypothetical protein
MPSNYIKNVKEIYIEWHERFFQNDEYHDVCKIKNYLINKFSELNIIYCEHH